MTGKFSTHPAHQAQVIFQVCRRSATPRHTHAPRQRFQEGRREG